MGWHHWETGLSSAGLERTHSVGFPVLCDSRAAEKRGVVYPVPEFKLYLLPLSGQDWLAISLVTCQASVQAGVWGRARDAAIHSSLAPASASFWDFG